MTITKNLKRSTVMACLTAFCALGVAGQAEARHHHKESRGRQAAGIIHAVADTIRAVTGQGYVVPAAPVVAPAAVVTPTTVVTPGVVTHGAVVVAPASTGGYNISTVGVPTGGFNVSTIGVPTGGFNVSTIGVPSGGFNITTGGRHHGHRPGRHGR